VTAARFVPSNLSGRNFSTEIRGALGRAGLLICLGYHPNGATTATPKADVIDELNFVHRTGGGAKAVFEIKVKHLLQQSEACIIIKPGGNFTKRYKYMRQQP
jgi:hypothetical protein